MLEKFKSRKFLLALVSQITALVILFVPEHTDMVTQIINGAFATLLSVGTAVGWIKAEASIDSEKLYKENNPFYNKENTNG